MHDMTHHAPDNQFTGSNYYRTLFELPRKNAVLLIDTDAIIRDVNPAFLYTFGYDKDEVIGQHLETLFSDADRAKDLPMREVRTVLDKGQAYDNNYLVNKDKTLTWVSGESLLLTDDKGKKSIVKIIQNIHVQKESETSITLLNHFNEQILASIEDAVIVLNKNFELLKANKAANQLFSLPPQGSAVIDFSIMLEWFDRQSQLQDLIAAAIDTGGQNGKIQLTFQKGLVDHITFEISCIRLEEGENVNALLIFHDITAQKAYEQQREDILNFVAHELGNPLTNLLLNIQLMDQLNQGEQSLEFKDCIQRSKSNIERLKKLTNELYRSTGIAAGNIALEKTSFRLSQAVDDTIHSLQQIYPHRPIERTGAGDSTIFADRDKLMHVLTNFLTNAIKYSDNNETIRIDIGKDKEMIQVSVTDKGRGISENDLPYIFNRFYRVKKNRGVEGLGIGLFLCRQIIEAHQGRIWVNSIEGKGSTFSFSLPLREK